MTRWRANFGASGGHPIRQPLTQYPEEREVRSERAVAAVTARFGGGFSLWERCARRGCWQINSLNLGPVFPSPRRGPFSCAASMMPDGAAGSSTRGPAAGYQLCQLRPRAPRGEVQQVCGFGSPDRLAGSAASRMFRRVSWRLSWYRSSVGACCRRRTAPRLIGAFSHSCQISPQSEGMAGMPSHSVKRGRRRLRELINYDNDLACEIGKFVQLDCDACTRRRRGFSLHPPPP